MARTPPHIPLKSAKARFTRVPRGVSPQVSLCVLLVKVFHFHSRLLCYKAVRCSRVCMRVCAHYRARAPYKASESIADGFGIVGWDFQTIGWKNETIG